MVSLTIMAKVKVDNEIMLDLIAKGLSTSEMARYFDVTPAAIRSKLVTLSNKYPDRINSSPLKIAKKNKLESKLTPIGHRVSNEVDRYLFETSRIHKHLSSMPIESDLNHLDQRSTIVLKGLQILEKIQKISTPSNQEQSRSLQTNTISVYLSQSGKNNSEPEPIDVQDVTS